MADIEKSVVIDVKAQGDIDKLTKLLTGVSGKDSIPVTVTIDEIKDKIKEKVVTIVPSILDEEWKKEFQKHSFEVNITPLIDNKVWASRFLSLQPFKVHVAPEFDDKATADLAKSIPEQVGDVLKKIPSLANEYLKKTNDTAKKLTAGISNVINEGIDTGDVVTALSSLNLIIGKISKQELFKKDKSIDDFKNKIGAVLGEANNLYEQLNNIEEAPTINISTKKVPITPDWDVFRAQYNAKYAEETKGLSPIPVRLNPENMDESVVKMINQLSSLEDLNIDITMKGDVKERLITLYNMADKIHKAFEIKITDPTPNKPQLDGAQVSAISTQVEGLKKSLDGIVVGINTSEFEEGLSKISNIVDEFKGKIDNIKHIEFTTNIDDIKKGIESLIGAKNAGDVVPEKQTETIRRRTQSPAPKKTNELAAGVFKQWVVQNESKNGSLKGLKKQSAYSKDGDKYSYTPEAIFKLIGDIKSNEYNEEKFLDDINILGGLEQSELSKPAFERYRKIISDTIRAMSFDETKDYERLISNLGTNIGLGMPNYSRTIGDNEDILSLMEGDKKILSDALPNLSGEDKSIAEALIKKIDNLIGRSYEEVVQEIKSKESTASNGIQIPIDIPIPNFEKIKEQIESLNNVDLSKLEAKFDDIKQKATIDISINTGDAEKQIEEYKQKSIEINAVFTGDSTVNVTPILNKTIWNKAITDIYTVNVKPKMTKDIWSTNTNKSYAVAIKPILTMEMWTKNIPTKLPLDVYADTIFIKHPETKVALTPTVGSIREFWKNVKQYFADNEIPVKLNLGDVKVSATLGKKIKQDNEDEIDPVEVMESQIDAVSSKIQEFIYGANGVSPSIIKEVGNLLDNIVEAKDIYASDPDSNPLMIDRFNTNLKKLEQTISGVIMDIGKWKLNANMKFEDAESRVDLLGDSNPYKKQLLNIVGDWRKSQTTSDAENYRNAFNLNMGKAIAKEFKLTEYTDEYTQELSNKIQEKIDLMSDGDYKNTMENFQKSLFKSTSADYIDRIEKLANRVFDTSIKEQNTVKRGITSSDIYEEIQSIRNGLANITGATNTQNWKNLENIYSIAGGVTDTKQITGLLSLAKKYMLAVYKEMVEPQPTKPTINSYGARVQEFSNMLSALGFGGSKEFADVTTVGNEIKKVMSNSLLSDNEKTEVGKKLSINAEKSFNSAIGKLVSPDLTRVDYVNKIGGILNKLTQQGKQNTDIYNKIVSMHGSALTSVDNEDAKKIYENVVSEYNKDLLGKNVQTKPDYIDEINDYLNQSLKLGIGHSGEDTLRNILTQAKTQGLDENSLKVLTNRAKQVFANFVDESTKVGKNIHDYFVAINDRISEMDALGLQNTSHYNNAIAIRDWTQSSALSPEMAETMYKAVLSAERNAIKEDAVGARPRVDTTSEHVLLSEIEKRFGNTSKLALAMQGLLLQVEAKDRKDIQQYRDFMKLYNLNNKAIRDKPSAIASIGAGAVKIGLGAIQKGINTIANLYIGLLNKVKGILMNIIRRTVAIAINPFKNSVKKFGSIIKQAGSKSKALSSLSELLFMPIVLAVEFTLLPVLKKMIPAIKQVIDWVVYSKDKFMLVGKYIGVVANKVYSMLVGNFVNGFEKFFDKLNEYKSWINELYNLDGDTFFSKLGIGIKQVSDNLNTLATVADSVNTELTDFAKNKNNGGIIMKFITEMELAIGRSINSATEAISNTIHTILTDPQLGEDVTTFINNTLSHLFKNVELTTEIAVTFFEKLSEGIKEYLNNEKNSTQIQNIANNVVGIIERVMDIATGQVIPKLFETGALQKAAVATAPIWGQILGVSLLSSMGGSILTGIGKFAGTKIKNKSISNGIMNGNQETSLFDKIKGVFSNNNKVTSKSGALTTGQNAQVNNIVKNFGSSSKLASIGSKLTKFLGPIGEAITVGTMGYGLVKSSQYNSSLENRDYMLVGDYLSGLVEATGGVAQYGYTEESLNEIAKYTGLTLDELKQLTNSELKSLTNEMYADSWKNGWGNLTGEGVLDNDDLLKFKNILKYGAVSTVDNSDIIESNKAASQTLLTLLSGRGIAIDSDTRKVWESTTGYVRDTYEELMKVATTTSDGITIIDPDISAIRSILEGMSVDKLKETSETGATNISDKPEAIYHDSSDEVSTWEDLATEYANKYLENPNQTLILPEGLSYNKLMEKVNELTNPNYGVSQVFEPTKFSLDEREKILDDILAQDYGANWVAVEKYAEKMGHLSSYYSSFLTEGNAEKLLTQRAAEIGYKSWLESTNLNPSVSEKTSANPINLGSGYGADNDVAKLITDIKEGQNVNLGINELQYLVSHSSGDYNKFMKGIVSDFDSQLSRYESINLNSLSVDLNNLSRRYSLTGLSELINPTKSLQDSPTIESFSPSISIYMDKDNKVTDSTVKYDNGLGTIRALNISGGI